MAKSWRDALKKGGAGHSAAAAAATTANPFELKFNKQKFNVLNKASGRGAALAGRPGASRKRAEELRRGTLLREYKTLSRTSKVIDRRFGRGSGADADDVSIRRFALARSRKDAKRARYQLSDDEPTGSDSSDRDSHLTHKGQRLTGQNMNDYIDSEEDGPAVNVDGFGNFGEKKSKADAMSELIAKSKFYKYERQKVKEENEQLRNDVDASFDVVRRGLLTDENRRRAGEEVGDDTDDFGSAVRLLSFERRLAAQNETKKTREELERIQLEKEYKKQEELRRRMLGDDAANEGDADGLELSRRMVAAEKELARTVNALCRSSTVAAAEEHYSRILNGLKGSSHRQVLLAKVCRDKIKRISASFAERVLQGKGFLNRPCPILLFQLIGQVFSTSDFHHLVATPAHLCALYLLSYGKMTKTRHCVLSLWLCKVLLSYQRLSKRYIPEVMNVLYSMVLFVHRPADDAPTSEPGRCCSYYLVRKIRGSFAGCLEFTTENTLASPDAVSLSSFREHLTLVVLQAANLYSGLMAFPEIFQPFADVMGCEQLRQMVGDSLASRSPLHLHDHKPVPLPQLDPFIEDEIVAVKGRRSQKSKTNPQHETQKLRTAHRKELRSAQRELRKDADFLAREKLAEKVAKDAEYRSRIGRLYGSLANEGSSKQSTK